MTESSSLIRHFSTVSKVASTGEDNSSYVWHALGRPGLLANVDLYQRLTLPYTGAERRDSFYTSHHGHYLHSLSSHASG